MYRVFKSVLGEMLRCNGHGTGFSTGVACWLYVVGMVLVCIKCPCTMCYSTMTGCAASHRTVLWYVV